MALFFFLGLALMIQPIASAQSASTLTERGAIAERGAATVAGWIEDTRVRAGEQLVAARLGAFLVNASLRVIGSDDTRTLDELILASPPRPSWVIWKNNWLGRHINVQPDPARPTLVRLEAVEIRERRRTLSVLRPNAMLREAKIRIPLDGTDSVSWANLEILLHVRFLLPDSPAAAAIAPLRPLLKFEGRRTLIYRPAELTLRDGVPQPVGRPLLPGRLEIIGAGLTIFPERPFAGETFTALAVFQNRGERPTAAQSLRWQFNDLTLDAEMPALSPERDVSLRFEAIAGVIPGLVSLRWGDTLVTTRLEPRLRPRLALTRLAADEGFAEDPLLIRAAIANFGTGISQPARLLLRAGDVETTLIVTPVAAGEKTAISVAWSETWPAALHIEAELYGGGESADSRSISLLRPPRPTPDLRIAEIRLLGDPTPGGAGRALVIVENRGTLEGMARLNINVNAVNADRMLCSETPTERVSAGGRITIQSTLFPYAAGINRASATLGGEAEFVQVYSAPPEFQPLEGETVLTLVAVPSGAASSGAASSGAALQDSNPNTVIRLAGERLFTLAPQSDLEELDTTVRLQLAATLWMTNASGTEFLLEGAAARREMQAMLKVVVNGAALSDRFTVAASESPFVYALPREALRETLTISLTPIARSPCYLTAPPSVRIAYSATERGRLRDVRATDSGLYISVINEAHWIPSDKMTVAATYENEDITRELVTPIARGGQANIFIPLPLLVPGRRMIQVSLPLSAVASERRLEQFILSNPPPRFEVVAALSAWSDQRDSGILGLVGVRDAAITDLRLIGAGAFPVTTANSPLRIDYRLPIVPADETAVVFFPSASAFSINYGPLSTRSSDAAGIPRPTSHLTILDLGGDSPDRGQPFVLRYTRYSDSEPLPPGRVYLAIDGILRTARPVPSLARGERWIDGFVLVRGPNETLDAVVYELDSSRSRAIVSTRSFSLDADVVGASAAPTRADREWTLPVRLATPSASETGVTPYERAAKSAWEITRFLAEQKGAVPPLTPATARTLERLSGDTSALGRMRYREQLWELVESWQLASQLLAGCRLPVTLEVEQFAAFRKSIEQLNILSRDVGVINRVAVETSLDDLANTVEFLIGKRVSSRY